MLEKNSELDYLGDHMRWNWTEHSKGNFRSDTDIGGKSYDVILVSILLVKLGIHILSFNAQSTVLIVVVDAHF